MDKVIETAADPVADIPNGAAIASGGFRIFGIPAVLIDGLVEDGITEPETFSNNCGTDGAGLGKLLENKRTRRIVASYGAEKKEYARRYLIGEVEVTAQGTLAERQA